MIYITDIPQNDANIFDCISLKNEIFIPDNDTAILDYMVTIYPRNEDKNDFPFVYGLFETKEAVFAQNQDIILNIASQMFSDSWLLNDLEQTILNKTFEKTIKIKPTLAGRK